MKILVVFASVVSLLAPSFAVAEPAPPMPVPPPVVMAPPAENGSATEAATKAAPKPLPPPTPERLALARQVVEAQGGAQGFNAIFNAGIDGMLTGLKPGPEVLALITPYRERLKTSLAVHMPQLVEVVAVGWARTYTDDELRGQLNYMRSSTAQSIVAKWPHIAAQLGQEFGWFIRQALLTDPSLSKYLADVTRAKEPPPSWPTPPPESLAIIKARIDASPGAALMKHPEKLIEQVTKGKKSSAVAEKALKRMAATAPVFFNDILVIMANNLTPEELTAQSVYLASDAGKAQVSKTGQVSIAIQADLKPILMQMLTDITKPPEKT